MFNAKQPIPPKNVVVIEDDLDVLEMLRLNLTMAGVQPHLASDGQAGLHLVRQIRPDAVLLDIKMPRMNGYEVCAAIQSDVLLADTPILIMTGLVEDPGPDTEKKWRDHMGIADFVVKPYDPVDLVNRVIRLFDPPVS